MKKKTTLLLLLAGICYALNSDAQQLASWTAAPAGGSFGSQWTPTATATNTVVGNFTKGAGVAGSGTPAGGSWGGSGGWSTTPTAGNTNGALYFTIKAADGYAISLTSIPTFYTRRSGQGPTGAAVLYSLNGGSTYTLITNITTTSASGSGNNSTNATLTNLSGIAALQNVPSTTTITIKIVPTNGANNWYIMYSGGGFVLNGTVATAPLPVTLRSFTASRANDQVQLSWETSFENNVSHFELEKSTDASHFAITGSVSATNKATGDRYTYTDKPASGTGFYRLKTVDKDGRYEYSKVVMVTGPAMALSKAILLQNPVSMRLPLLINEKTAYTIVDLKGTIISSGTIGDEEAGNVIDVSRLSKGLYLLRLQNQRESRAMKFIKE